MRRIAWVVLVALVHVALLSAAIETFVVGSPVRRWVIGLVAGYLTGAVAVWRWEPARRLVTSNGLLSVGVGALLMSFAFTAWLPNGLTNGIRLFGLSTSVLMAAITAVAVAGAALTLVRVRQLPLALRYVVALLAVYGVLAFGIGISDRTPYHELLTGASAWSRLPFWLQGSFLGAFGLIPAALAIQLLTISADLSRRRPVPALVHRTTALTMVLVLLLAGLRSPSQIGVAKALPLGSTVPGSPRVPATVASRTRQDVDAVLHALASAERDIPRQTFDSGVVVRELGDDPIRLFSFVRDRTFWVPYRGVLRGPVGVLMDRLGNSLDRSLLLAELLKKAHQTVRLAHCDLSEARAGELLPVLRPVPEDPLPAHSPDSQDMDADLTRYAESFRMDASQIKQDFADLKALASEMSKELGVRTEAQVRALSNAVGAPASSASAARAIEALRDHWWVQRLAAGEWENLDPLLPDAQPGTAVGVESRTVEVPAADQQVSFEETLSHEVVIRVVVEQWRDGHFVENTALEHNFRPAALFGQTIKFQHVPMRWPDSPELVWNSDPFKALTARTLDQDEWLPLLTVGDEPIFKASVNSSGNLVTRTSDATAQNGKAQSDAFSGGMDSLGGGEESGNTNGSFTAEWLEYEIRVPGQPPRRIRREIFDLVGASRRSDPGADDPAGDPLARKIRAFALLGSIEILPLMCRLSPEYISAQAVTEASRGIAATPGIFEGLAKGDEVGAINEMLRLRRIPTPLYNLAWARFAWSPVAHEVYLDAPNIVSYRTDVVPAGTGEVALMLGFDIVANGVAVRDRKAAPFVVRLTQGVVDTNTEALLFGPQAVNAGNLFATTAADQWVVVRTLSDASSAGANWPVAVRARIENATRNGLAVVAPRSMVGTPNTGQWTWWTIDPETGETLGTGEQGGGQVQLLYEVVKIMIQQAANIAIGGFGAGALFFLFCMGKKQLTGKGSLSTPNDPQSQKAATECGCSALDIGVTVAPLFVAPGASGLAAGLLASKIVSKFVCA